MGRDHEALRETRGYGREAIVFATRLKQPRQRAGLAEADHHAKKELKKVREDRDLERLVEGNRDREGYPRQLEAKRIPPCLPR